MTRRQDLAEKASGLGNLLAQQKVELVDVNAKEQGRAPVTGPGRAFAFRNDMIAADDAITELKKKIALHDGSTPVRNLDATVIGLSKYANRHEASFKVDEFEILKSQIAMSGGNVEAILVRPNRTGKGAHEYEIAFGQRRWRACLALNLPVKAEIREMSDQELHSAMTFENEGGADLSPYEKGLHYQRALDDKIYTTQEQLAAAYAKTQPYVSRMIRVAKLPAEVIDAFASPLDFRAVWLEEMEAALKVDRAGVLERAKETKEGGAGRSAAAILVALLLPKATPKIIEIKHKGKPVAALKTAGGKVSIVFKKGVVSQGKIDRLKRVLTEFLGEE